MTAITFTAVDRGALASGHTAGVSYDLETASHVVAPSRKEIGGEAVALDGTTEGMLDRIERGFDVTTDYVESANIELWEEFIDSVAAKEPFSFDALGTIASPDNPQTVEMVGAPVPRRVGATAMYQYSFKVRVL